MLFVYLDSHFDVFIKQYLAWDQMSFRKPEPENFSPWKTWSQFLKDPQAYFFVLFFFSRNSSFIRVIFWSNTECCSLMDVMENAGKLLKRN